MNKKEILATIEISDYEIRLIVAECHNLKFNVLKVERIECSGVSKIETTNQEVVIACIKKAVNNASKLIGAPIKRVIVLVPSYRFTRVAKRIIVSTKEGYVTSNDVSEAIKTARFIDLGENREIVNIMPYRYIVNGAATKKAPLNEKSDSLAVEIEVLACDKNIVYSYVGTVEKAGLEVVDICCDTYALALEAALFEQSIQNYILLIKMERQTTTMSLIANGKLASSTILDVGYAEIVGHITDEVKLPNGIAARLLLHNLHIGSSELSTSPIYYWSIDEVPHTISEAQIADIAMPEIERWAKKIKDITADILSAKDVKVVLSGDGAEMIELDKYLSQLLEKDTTTYIPETLGIRTSGLSACFGALYAYRDQRDFKTDYQVSIDDLTFFDKKEQTTNENTKSNRFARLFANKGD